MVDDRARMDDHDLIVFQCEVVPGALKEGGLHEETREDGLLDVLIVERMRSWVALQLAFLVNQ